MSEFVGEIRKRWAAAVAVCAAVALTVLGSPAMATGPTMPTIAWGDAGQTFLTQFGTVFSALLGVGILLLVIKRGWGWLPRMLK